MHFPNWAYHPTSAQGLAARSKAAQISTQSLREQHAAICMEEPLGISLGEWHRGCCRLSMLQHNMLFGSVGEASWHQRWHTKGSVFPFTVVCTCQNGVFCFFVVVLCAPPAHWPCCSVAPQRPLVELGSIAAFACMCGNMCVCVWSRTPNTFSLTPSLSHTLWYKHSSSALDNIFCSVKPSTNSGPFFLNPKTRSSRLTFSLLSEHVALEGQIRAGLGKIQSLLSLN